MDTSADLQAIAQELLDACVVALEDTPAGPPPFAYVTPGPPAWDCEQLTVMVGGPDVAPTSPTSPALSPGHRVAAYGEVVLVQLVASVVRCVPTLDEDGQVPPAAAMSAAAAQLNADVWAIWNYLRAAKRAGTLFAPDWREVLFDPPLVKQQQGGFGGWDVPVRVQLSLYAP